MFYFNQSFAQGVGGRNHQEQFMHLTQIRRAFNAAQQDMQTRFATNGPALIPRDVYREFDNQTIQLLRQNNLTIFNDLMPLAKALSVGKIENVHRRVSDSGSVIVSLGGKPSVDLDKADYDYDSSIKVIHQSGFGREWMEIEGQRTEGFDALVDDQGNSVRAVMDSLASHFIDGRDDVQFKSHTAYGIKSSSKTMGIDLGNDGGNGINTDLTTAGGEAQRTAFRSIVDRVRRNDNNVKIPLTFYVSGDIASKQQDHYNANDVGYGTIREDLLKLDGVADIKEDESLSGNEMIVIALDAQYIRPLVGMAVSTFPVQRLNQFDKYSFVTWANAGLEIRTDYGGRTGVAWAREITSIA